MTSRQGESLERASRPGGVAMGARNHTRWQLVDCVLLDMRRQLGARHVSQCGEELADVGLYAGSSGAEGEGVEAEACSIDVSTPSRVQK